MRNLLFLAALALLASPLPAAACSVAAGYSVPTNLELVENADLILLATVEDGTADPRSADEMRIRIRPLAALKGTIPAGSITLPGAMLDGAAELSNPYDLEQAHPQSFAGACIRYAFPRGSRVLFFLRAEGDGWVPSARPFSRWAEDVPTDEAPWLAAVRFYAEVAALPEAGRKTALVARRDALRARIDSPVAQLLAKDIDRQLAGPNKPLRAAPD
jgi:hypothetical protein